MIKCTLVWEPLNYFLLKNVSISLVGFTNRCWKYCRPLALSSDENVPLVVEGWFFDNSFKTPLVINLPAELIKGYCKVKFAYMCYHYDMVNSILI